MIERDATAASRADVTVGETIIQPPGTDEPASAIASKPTSNGCAASATIAASGGIGASSKPRKSMGCASVISGAAARFVSGPTRLMRPNVQATSGALTIVATVETTSPAMTVRRHPAMRCGTARLTSEPAAISAATPITLSW